MRRHPVNKGYAAKKFRGNMKRTKAPNVAPPPQRGGYRL